MRCVAAKPDVFVDRSENPMDVLGIGANMVKALRYWLQAVGLTAEPNRGKRTQSFTEFGQLVYDNDKYLEELGTLLLLQYKLAVQKEEATAWYFFFNEFSMYEFSREDFVEALQKYVKMENSSAVYAIRSLNDDFACIVNTYVPRARENSSRVSPENNIECPLCELGLMDVLNRKRKTYKKCTPAGDSLNPWILLAVIADNAGERKEIPISELLRAPGNIGRVFNLDSITLLDGLYGIEKLGLIRINRTAGLDVISLNGTYTFLGCVEQFYASIGNY